MQIPKWLLPERRSIAQLAETDALLDSDKRLLTIPVAVPVIIAGTGGRAVGVDGNGRLPVTNTPALSLNAEVASRFMSIGAAVEAGHLAMTLVAGEGVASVVSSEFIRYTAHGTTENTALRLTLTPAAGTVVILHAAILIPPSDAGVETHNLQAHTVTGEAGIWASLISIVNGSSETMDAQRSPNSRAPILMSEVILRWSTTAAVQAASVGNLHGLVEVLT